MTRKIFHAAVLSALPWLAAPAPVAAREFTNALELARQLNQAFIEVADTVSPAVVVVRVAHKRNLIEAEDDDDSWAPFFERMPREFRRWFEERRERQRREDPKEPKEREEPRDPIFDGQGSGVIIRKEGYILTNRHVVEGADKIKIRFLDGSEFDGEIRGVDAQSDVAVVKIDPKGKALTVARLGNSDKTRVGEFAIAIGAPFELDYSVTFGHVSAKGRSRIIPDQSADQDFIQTDADINPGNSGGPLVNIEGEVIGINTLIRGLRTGIGFAIPVNLAREVSDKLISEGKFVRAYLGVKIRSLKEDTEYRDAITGVDDGVVVSEIPPDGPAAKSDLKPGDVITAVEGKHVSTPQQLRNEIRSKTIGAPVTLDVHRFGKNIKVKVKPEAWPDEMPPMAVKKPAVPEEKTRSFGLTVQSISKDLAEQFGLEKMEGVVITEVERGSVAEKKGLKPGDVVTEVNQKPVTNPKQFREALQGLDLKKGVIINYTSRGTSKFEILKETGD